MNKTCHMFCALAALMLAACNDDDATSIVKQEVQIPNELRFKMDVVKPSFDGTTRAGGAGWEQNDSLFLRFTKTGGYAYGIAVYEASTGDWIVKDVPTLDLEETKKLELAYLDGSKTVNGNTVTLSPTTAVYTGDGNGTYLLTMANNFAPIIKGHLVPRTARLRFKGEAGTTVTVSGLKYNNTFNTSTFAATTDTADITLTVGSDGYTPYTYCSFAHHALTFNHTLTVIQDITMGTSDYRYTYTATCPATMLQTGKSGWMNLPTYNSHNGWEMKAEALYITPGKTSVEMSSAAGSQTVSIEANITWSATSSASWLTCTKKSNTELTLTATANTDSDERVATISIKNEKGTVKATISVKQKCGYEYVDLGLSVKWATCNVGASKPEEWGHYYAWGETKEKSDYTFSTYLKDYGGTMSSYSDCGTSKDPLKDYVYPNNKSIGGTQYDVAQKVRGGTWRMPTLNEFKELVNNCDATKTTLNGVDGCKVTSKKNGNSIFLPCAGYRVGTSSKEYFYYCYYWSSTPFSNDCNSAYVLEFNSISLYFGWNNAFGRDLGLTVRPVSE